MRNLFTEVEKPQMKQNPPRPPAAGMGFKAPTGKMLSGDGGKKKREKKGELKKKKREKKEKKRRK